MEQREAEAKTRSDEALAKAQIAESAVLEAERRVMASVAEQKDLQVKLAETEKIKLEYEEAQARLKTLENQVQQQRLEIAKAQAKEEEARRVQTELLVRNEERVEEHAAKTAELQKQVVTLEVQKDNESQKVAKLEEEKRLSEEEAAKSVWVKRDEALRNMNIQYTEYSSSGDRDYTTDKTLTMPLVKIGDLVFVPAEFEKLGLKSSFFGGGLSDYVTDVKGELRSSKDEEIGWSKITSILVSGKEPQVCLVRFAGNSTGAISAISMDELKEQRIRSALLFTPDEITEYSNVQIMPIVGTDYLKIIAPDGKKPKVGDYLLSERGDFIGVMVTKENAYVIANSLQGIPAPISIPMVRGKDSDGYFNEFIKMLAIARERVKIQMGIRNL